MNDFGTLLVIIAVVALSLRVGYAFSRAPSPNLGATAQQTRPEPVIIRYQGGELAIDAYNAPLDDILRAVCQRTGALIDVPQEATERVTRQIGPWTRNRSTRFTPERVELQLPDRGIGRRQICARAGHSLFKDRPLPCASAD